MLKVRSTVSCLHPLSPKLQQGASRVPSVRFQDSCAGSYPGVSTFLGLACLPPLVCCLRLHTAACCCYCCNQTKYKKEKKMKERLKKKMKRKKSGCQETSRGFRKCSPARGMFNGMLIPSLHTEQLSTVMCTRGASL